MRDVRDVRETRSRAVPGAVLSFRQPRQRERRPGRALRIAVQVGGQKPMSTYGRVPNRRDDTRTAHELILGVGRGTIRAVARGAKRAENSRPRLLANRSEQGYTSSVYESMPGEPEAVSEEEQASITRAVREGERERLLGEWRRTSTTIDVRANRPLPQPPPPRGAPRGTTSSSSTPTSRAVLTSRRSARRCPARPSTPGS
jgi:hypothetical protein